MPTAKQLTSLLTNKETKKQKYYLTNNPTHLIDFFDAEGGAGSSCRVKTKQPNGAAHSNERASACVFARAYVLCATMPDQVPLLALRKTNTGRVTRGQLCNYQ